MALDDIQHKIRNIEIEINNLKNNIDSSIDGLKDTLEKVKDGLLGSLDSEEPGILSRVRENDARLTSLLQIVEKLKETTEIHERKIIIYDSLIKKIEEIDKDNQDTKKRKWALNWIISILGTTLATAAWKVIDYILKKS